MAVGVTGCVYNSLLCGLGCVVLAARKQLVDREGKAHSRPLEACPLLGRKLPPLSSH